MEKVFLTAQWQNLIMANYEIDPNLLKPYLPANVEIDFWNGKTYVSLVGFMFKNTKVLGYAIPFHNNFEEVNLRFYVRYKENGLWKRGVVFIREIVPLPTIAWTANIIYREPYITLKMKNSFIADNQAIHVKYEWKYRGEWNSLEVNASSKAIEIAQGSEAEFITEHYWGYTKWDTIKTAEYQVEHPRWNIYPVFDYKIQCNILQLYGKEFIAPMQMPSSVLLAEGSDIVVRKGVFL